LRLWHHWTGLVFGILTLTWLFSGLLSLNPWGTLESRSFALEEFFLQGEDGMQLTTAQNALADISSLCVAPDRSLWLLSDKSESVARLAMTRALRPDEPEISELDDVWRLPKKVSKPEGMVFLDERRLLIALDTRSKSDNAIVVEPPDDRRLW